MSTTVFAKVILFSLSAVSLCQAEEPTKERTKKIYDTYCYVCHGTGWQGAPMTGTSDWDTRVAKGMDELVVNALKGLNGMPPKGTCAECSDAELCSATKLMIAE